MHFASVAAMAESSMHISHTRIATAYTFQDEEWARA